MCYDFFSVGCSVACCEIATYCGLSHFLLEMDFYFPMIVVGRDLKQKVKGALRLKVCFLGVFLRVDHALHGDRRRFCEMGVQPLLESLTPTTLAPYHRSQRSPDGLVLH